MNPVQYTLMTGVRLYRWVLSPAKAVLFGPLGRCRFTPSCSEYALQAIGTHGALRGSWLAVVRICRCNPWGGCGEDPVPVAECPVHTPEPKGTRHPDHGLACHWRACHASEPQAGQSS